MHHVRDDDEQAPAPGAHRPGAPAEPEPGPRHCPGPTDARPGHPGPAAGGGASPQHHEGATPDAAIPERNETPTERSDRNWDELMQELRVTQTGIQILTAFLLTLPFQPRFGDLDSFQRGMYLVLVVLAVTTTALLVAPVSMHRRLFQRRRKPVLVQTANTLAQIGLLTFALVVTGTVAFVFEMVLGPPATSIAAGAAAVLLLGLWLVLPWRIGRRPPPA